MAKNADQFEERPWGNFEVIYEFSRNDNEEEFVIKKLTVYPQKRLSYQSHSKRREHWHVIEGEGAVILDDREFPIKSESKIEVPIGTKHRIINTHEQDNLVIIEITAGEFDEHDIIRHQDDFGR